MATAQELESSSTPPPPPPLLPSVLKCGSCRQTLQNVKPPPPVKNDQKDAKNQAKLSPEVIPVVEDDSRPMPAWIQEKIEQSGWTRGKLCCPSCSARIGGFDFVGGSRGAPDIPIYLVRSKVDVHTPKDLAQLLTESREANWPPREQRVQDEGDSSSSSASSSSSSSSTDLSSTTPSNTSSSLSSHAEEMTPASSSSSPTPSAAQQEEANKLAINQILTAEPELDAVDESLVCPVCLDVFHEPFRTLPCSHTFCEPCLRRLGSKNPMNTLCPMCRTRIVYCEPEREKAASVRALHPALHQKRKKFERSTNVYNLPLPWRPGWRNLMSGRAMGGNMFHDDSLGQFFRRLLHLLPYYVPPVLIANLINLLLFVFLMGAVEVVPRFLSIIVGKTPTDLQLQQPAIGAEHVGASASGGGGGGMTPAVAGSGDGRMPETTDARQAEIFARAIFPDYTPESEVSSSPSSPPYPATMALAWDATFYYVLGTMSIIVAAFGNFLLIHQQPAIGLFPQQGGGGGGNGLGVGLLFGLDHFYRRLGDLRRLRRLSDLFVVLALSLFPLFLLPLLLPIQTATDQVSWVRTVFHLMVECFLSARDVVQSYMTFTTVVVVGLAYWIGSVYREYEEDGDEVG